MKVLVVLMVFAASIPLNLVAGPGRAETWNVGDDFSPSVNPAGAWSYGWRNTPGNPLVLYVEHSNVDEWGTCALDVWYTPPGSWSPEVWHNPHDYTLWCGPTHSTENPPNSVHFHPGTTEQSVIRWTAPRDMEVSLSAVFTAIDGGSSNVYVYRNGTELFHTAIAGYDDMVSFEPIMELEAGDVVDCAVGAISYFYDTVRVDITFTSEEPAVGACCFPAGVCLQGTQVSCLMAGGYYVGDGILCDPNPCGPTAVEASTWGRVKATYRN